MISMNSFYSRINYDLVRKTNKTCIAFFISVKYVSYLQKMNSEPNYLMQKKFTNSSISTIRKYNLKICLMQEVKFIAEFFANIKTDFFAKIYVFIENESDRKLNR